jgi:hypothetical protein
MNHQSTLGVCIFDKTKRNFPDCNSHRQYIFEILEHAGLPFMQIQPETLSELLPELKLLVTVGDAQLEDSFLKAIRKWVQQGGAWLSLGSICDLGDVHGVQSVSSPGYRGKPFAYEQCTLGEGYLRPDRQHPVLDLLLNLHYYNGIIVKVLSEQAEILASTLDAHGSESGFPALVESTFGDGHTLFLAPDAVGAVVRISHGTAVTADGISAPDGSAPVNDNMLKCDDGQVLDWHFDRQEVPGVPGIKGFFEPVADQWREVILRSIFYLAAKVEMNLSLLWLYPRNLPALAHLSHDTDGNNPALGERMLEEVGKAGIHSTWCVIKESAIGYPKWLIEKIKAAGHELAIHYNAVNFPWSEEEFALQYRQLTELFGEFPVSNKSHYTRWEGGTEFFDWCRRQNIALDQTKGPSKLGEVGFNFGTAQLYFPLADNGEIHIVLEQTLHTQDLMITAPPEIIPPLLNAIKKHHGVLHALFHPAHIAKDGVAESLQQMIQQAKEFGLEWVTAAQLNSWERARRKVNLLCEYEKNCSSPKVLLSSPESLADATILTLGKHQNIEINGQPYPAQSCVRWGVEFSAVTLDVDDDFLQEFPPSELTTAGAGRS